MKNIKSEKAPNKKKKGSLMPVIIFLFMFILPGLIGGMFFTVKTVGIQNWVEVEATVDSTYYKYKTIKKRRKRPGRPTGKTKSYTVAQARATYSYEWNGKTYQSNQVAYRQPATKDKARNAALKKLLSEAKTVKAFVNPNAPEEAVLARNFHNGILFFYVSAFACFFFFGAISGLILKFPNFRFGMICLILIVVLYAWFFGMGGVYLINHIEVLS